MQNLKVEKYVLFGRQNWGFKPGSQPLGSERLLQRGKGGAFTYPIMDIQEFLRQKPGSWNLKRLLLKKIRYLKWRNLALFYAWEDARVWAHWNHFLDMHLNCLGPVSCFSHSWIPCRVHCQGCVCVCVCVCVYFKQLDYLNHHIKRVIDYCVWWINLLSQF